MYNKLIFGISLCMLSTGLFGQIQGDSVFTYSDITLETPTGDISGTLTVPINVQTSPVVLIIAGSGPTDRDCNSALGLQTNTYKMLAEAFAAKGISTLRFDKRGIGKSKTAMTSESDLRFDDLINDVVSWINMLKADNRFSKIILLGHSEGSLIGMVAAQKAEVAGFISAAGAGKSADKILEEQLKTKLTPPLLEESNQILDSLRQGKTVSIVNPGLLALYRPSVQPYLISWMKYDPATEVKKLKIPVLIIQGTTDLQVTLDDANMLAAARPDAKLLVIEGMNHVLKESGSDFQANIATYKNPNLPLKPGVAEGMTDFVLSLP
jgi:uncharacterized protein